MCAAARSANALHRILSLTVRGDNDEFLASYHHSPVGFGDGSSVREQGHVGVTLQFIRKKRMASFNTLVAEVRADAVLLGR
jgi:hypothetical protein